MMGLVMLIVTSSGGGTGQDDGSLHGVHHRTDGLGGQDFHWLVLRPPPLSSQGKGVGGGVIFVRP